MRKNRKLSAIGALGASLLAGAAFAAVPPSGTISPTSPTVSWQGQAYTAAVVASVSACPPSSVDTANLVCDHFRLTVNADSAYWSTHTGGATVTINWADSGNDFDLYIFDAAGNEVASSASGGTTSEQATAIKASGTYDVVVVPYTVTNSSYTGSAALASEATATGFSRKWNSPVNNGQCCEGNLAASGPTTYVLLPELTSGNDILRSGDGGKTWKKVYPPADVSVPFGIEGDLRAFGNDVIYFGTEVAQGVTAHSSDRGDTWTIEQVPVASAGNDQAWLYLGPVPGVCPVQTKPYVLTGWFRIGAVAVFSCDGGLTWPIQTPLVGVDGDGPAHVVCETTAHDPVKLGDRRVRNAAFANMKAGRHGGWGTDGKFYWSEAVDGNLFVCKTGTFGATWEGVKHPQAAGTPSGQVVTTLAFDDKGTLYVLHANKLYVSFDQGESIRYVHTLPKWGNDSSVADGAAEWFAVSGGTIHIGLKEASPDGKGAIWYLKGKNVDSGRPSWKEELVNSVGAIRLDFMQIAVDGNGIPTIGYTSPPDFILGVTTSSRTVAP